ncbi:MAG: membrane associated rhomboid family serine protease [Chlamydiales bacterium]|jgi:membrane associated rhomboid family serine protease
MVKASNKCEKCKHSLPTENTKCPCGFIKEPKNYFNNFHKELKKRPAYGTYLFLTIFILVNVQMISIDLSENYFSAFISWQPEVPIAQETLYRYGGINQEAILANFEGWRLISSSFLQNNCSLNFLVILSFLCIALPLERIIGTKSFVRIFIVSGLFGNLSTLYFLQPGIVHGTLFFPIFGIISALLSLCYKNRDIYPNRFFKGICYGSFAFFVLGLQNYFPTPELTAGLLLAMVYGASDILLRNANINFQPPILIQPKKD